MPTSNPFPAPPAPHLRAGSPRAPAPPQAGGHVRWRATIRFAVVAIAAALGTLATADIGGGGAWYERYERGIELEHQGAWEEAAREFGAALQGERFPRRRILTKERSFLFGYDPHFHLARCLVELARFKEAGFHLALSRKAGVTPPEQLRTLAARIEEGLRSGQTGERRSGARAGETEALTDPASPAAGSPAGDAAAPAMAAVPTAVVVARPETLPTEVPPTPALPKATPTMPLPAATSAPAVAALEFPERSSLPTLLLVVAVVTLAAFAVFLWLRLRNASRVHRQESGATAATGRLETAVTVLETQARLGGYQLAGMLGRGGMATTYQALRDRDGAMVALKVPHEGCLADATFVARFLREGRLGEQLHHPRIVRIFEASEDCGRPFLAMELLHGRTLKQVLRDEAPLPLRKAVEIGRDVAEALDYAHAKGVIHRDLKPENIMMLEGGTLKVMDFGIARVPGEAGLTASQFFLGTPLYAAPEMVEPKRIDHRVDLYALGIIFFEMLEGTVPFSADSPYRVLEMHMRQPLPPHAELPRPVPERLWRIVQRLCEKDPEARYPSAEALLVELHRLLQHFSELEGEGD